MKEQFRITKEEDIQEILDGAEYGVLAICADNRPYSVPVNFVYREGVVYFHGSRQGKKSGIMKANSKISLSIVESYSMIQSYFSSTEGLACPATHFFASVHIQGEVEIVESYDEKVLGLEALMKKLQPEGMYRPMGDEAYKNRIDATEVFKIVPNEICGKLKVGQHLPQERFDMILENLEKRGSERDLKTLAIMKAARG